MPILPYLDHQPEVAPNAFVAPSGYVIGRVTVGPDASIWFGAVVRGDVEPVTLGRGVNIQEHAVLHTDVGFPTVMGDYTSLGHHAIVHGAVLEDHVLIAMSATVLSGAHIGAGSIVAANALVPENRLIPPRSLVVGTPGKVIREISEAEYARIVETADSYMQLAREYLATERRSR